MANLVHRFGPNLAIFYPFFRQCRPGKCVLRYSRRKKRLSKVQKRRSSKSRKIAIFPKGFVDGFGPKLAILF